MKRWTSGRAAIVVGVVLVAVGIGLAADNPSIDHTDVGTYQCFAPYDTILLGARNDVGMHADPAGIEHRCYDANRSRLIEAGMLAGCGTVLGAVGVVGLIRRRRRAQSEI